jgi:hypothetical protein
MTCLQCCPGGLADFRSGAACGIDEMFGESTDPPGFFERFHLLSNKPHDSIAPFAQADARQPRPPGNPIDT